MTDTVPVPCVVHRDPPQPHKLHTHPDLVWCLPQVAAWQQELVADYGGTPASEADGSAGGVANWGMGDSGAVRPQAPANLTRGGVSSEQDAEWQALLTAQQVCTCTIHCLM